MFVLLHIRDEAMASRHKNFINAGNNRFYRFHLGTARLRKLYENDAHNTCVDCKTTFTRNQTNFYSVEYSCGYTLHLHGTTVRDCSYEPG